MWDPEFVSMPDGSLLWDMAQCDALLAARNASGPHTCMLYSGKAVRAGGLKLSENVQICIMDLLGAVHGQSARYIDSSPENMQVLINGGSAASADVYGELLPQGVIDMLWRVGAKPGDRFYDLGAGTGKVVIVAWLMGLRATGVEVSSRRWEGSVQAMSILKEIVANNSTTLGTETSSQRPNQGVHASMDYVHASFFDVDFTDADIVFTNSVMFSPPMLARLASTARWMKPGSLIISYELLPGPEFKEISILELPTSWNTGTSFHVQEVASSPLAMGIKPPGILGPHQFHAQVHCIFHENGLLDDFRQSSLRKTLQVNEFSTSPSSPSRQVQDQTTITKRPGDVNVLLAYPILEGSIPVQMEFHVWAHALLDLWAQGNYLGAEASMNEMAQAADVASQEHTCSTEVGENCGNLVGLGAVGDHGYADADGEESVSDEDEGRYRRWRCFAAYARALREHMISTISPASTQPALATDAMQPSVPYEVRNVPGKGFGMVALGQIQCGEEIVVQQPLAQFRQKGNTAPMALCAECYLALGTLEAQWGQLPPEGRPPFPSSFDDVNCPKNGLCLLPCPNGGICSAVFCSMSCQERALSGHHGLLCPEILESEQTEAYERIIQLDNEWDHPNALLAVQLTAAIIMVASQGTKSGGQPTIADALGQHGGDFASAPWESLADDAEEAGRRERAVAELVLYMQILFGQSLVDLCDATAVCLLLSPAAISHRIGMLELVGIQVYLEQPLAHALSHQNSGTNDEGDNGVPTDLENFAVSPTGRWLQKPVKASAIVPFVSFMNSSCLPNVDIEFSHRADQPGLWCVMTATRTIAAGEEFTMAYIPVLKVPCSERRAKLQCKWGFWCRCIRCIAEEGLSDTDLEWFSAFPDGLHGEGSSVASSEY